MCSKEKQMSSSETDDAAKLERISVQLWADVDTSEGFLGEEEEKTSLQLLHYYI